MFRRRRDAAIDGGHERGQIRVQHRGNVEPQPGKQTALEDAMIIGAHRNIATLAEREPIDRRILGPPDQTRRFCKV